MFSGLEKMLPGNTHDDKKETRTANLLNCFSLLKDVKKGRRLILIYEMFVDKK